MNPDPTLTALLRSAVPQALLGAHQYQGQETVLVHAKELPAVARFLKEHPAAQFDVLMDLGGVDYLTFGKALKSAPSRSTPSPLPYYMNPKPVKDTWDRLVPDSAYRFEVVYHLYSSVHNHRLRVKVPLPSADPVVGSVTGLWAAADWFERETWDMYGIHFDGHPDLRRILMYEEFKGHPLRKDYPIYKRQPLMGPSN